MHLVRLSFYPRALDRNALTNRKTNRKTNRNALTDRLVQVGDFHLSEFKGAD